MKKNNDKYIRIGIFVFVFLFGLYVSAKTENGVLALITIFGVPVLYIPYGISDWYRKKPAEPSEKRSKPKEPAVFKSLAKKEKASAPPQQAEPVKKTLTLLGNMRGYGTSAWLRLTENGIEMIVEYHAPNPFEHFGVADIVPEEIIRQKSLQALQGWMYSHQTPAFHEEITVSTSDYLKFLHECGY